MLFAHAKEGPLFVQRRAGSRNMASARKLQLLRSRCVGIVYLKKCSGRGRGRGREREREREGGGERVHT